MLTRVTEQALQIHGGSDIGNQTLIERVYRDAARQRLKRNQRDSKDRHRGGAAAGIRHVRRRFEDKIALITGSSRGSGAGLALTLAREGASIVVTSIATRSCRETVREIEHWGRARSRFRQIWKSPSRSTAYSIASRRVRPPRSLRLQRRGQLVQKVLDLKAHNLDRSYALNVRAFVLGSQRAVKLMDQGGRIACSRATAACEPIPTYANLGSNKAAIEPGCVTWRRVRAARHQRQRRQRRLYRHRIVRLFLRKRPWMAPSKASSPSFQKRAWGPFKKCRRDRLPALAGIGVHHGQNDLR